MSIFNKTFLLNNPLRLSWDWFFLIPQCTQKMLCCIFPRNYYGRSYVIIYNHYITSLTRTTHLRPFIIYKWPGLRSYLNSSLFGSMLKTCFLWHKSFEERRRFCDIGKLLPKVGLESRRYGEYRLFFKTFLYRTVGRVVSTGLERPLNSGVTLLSYKQNSREISGYPQILTDIDHGRYVWLHTFLVDIY